MKTTRTDHPRWPARITTAGTLSGLAALIVLAAAGPGYRLGVLPLQARWLMKRQYAFERRADGTIALRQAEYDAHTLSTAKPRGEKRQWRQDLSPLDKAG